MKRSAKLRLALNRETLRTLDASELEAAPGGHELVSLLRDRHEHLPHPVWRHLFGHDRDLLDVSTGPGSTRDPRGAAGAPGIFFPALSPTACGLRISF